MHLRQYNVSNVPHTCSVHMETNLKYVLKDSYQTGSVRSNGTLGNFSNKNLISFALMVFNCVFHVQLAGRKGNVFMEMFP
jgi:hypothetical protein